MSLHETPMLRKYWDAVGGILIEEFLAVPKGPGQGPRCIDGVIIKSPEKRVAKRSEVNLKGQHVTIVQVKKGRLGMYLLGQALFSIDLIKRFEPASIQSIALCQVDDQVLRPLFERYPNCQVVTIDDLKSKHLG